ncbi:MAG TPA: hypothetical protein VHL34_25020 [Rhizomicrobium sp.]|nr:hypothetical protein [Rhizomicrobium sp.]
MADTDPRWTLGGPPWRADIALGVVSRLGCSETLPALLETVQRSLAPASRKWLADRLSVMNAQFAVNRSTADADTVTVWMSETIRLLGDVPHDILAASIDQAIRAGRSGFMPTVGEILAVADPVVNERQRQAERLEAMVKKMFDQQALGE